MQLRAKALAPALETLPVHQADLDLKPCHSRNRRTRGLHHALQRTVLRTMRISIAKTVRIPCVVR
ncbi:hypothetical protein FOQG_03287 [Fusarium oxysporum f. sp. raphani 54005]|jgi:hypothetical protein|uniref:Uncharacterized protein n=4 Tax=Fusarium oxysporum TaxID=5507 RepID=X0DPD5_FUSOX|nr:hypothetical protein FOVG_00447 [Fusarium oxysporum f. sp. pisi HDV247]EXK96157.1 hypothetical protein FOQG_03287 [Fusarium oxysporum f. sp. raphani 54005]EXL89407.1 hypothetical protein FOPG_00123 [Fusarium oxysporum f. sp. conglutinans race 2 54008]EXM30372.1 hypothetical protein FOTG_04365 [Fusarium oxysporum f. sp. vasinfectum 25433]